MCVGGGGGIHGYFGNYHIVWKIHPFRSTFSFISSLLDKNSCIQNVPSVWWCNQPMTSGPLVITTPLLCTQINDVKYISVVAFSVILVPWPGFKPALPQPKCAVLTTIQSQPGHWEYARSINLNLLLVQYSGIWNAADLNLNVLCKCIR